MQRTLKTLWVLLLILIACIIISFPIVFDWRLAFSGWYFVYGFFAVGGVAWFGIIFTAEKEIFYKINDRYCVGIGHKWDGCECKRCGLIRDEQHDWCGCMCERCGKTRDEQHNWNGCTCFWCEKKRDEKHVWEGCICRRCGKTRDEQHDWDGCVCRRCRKTCDEQHDWDGCVCRSCGTSRHEKEEGTCTCKICGMILSCDLSLSGSITKETSDYQVYNGWNHYFVIRTIGVQTYSCSRCGREYEKESIISTREEH